MAEPSLKDVLNAIVEMRREMSTKKDLAEVRADMATRKELGAFESRVDKRLETLTTKKEMRERFDGVDDRLDALRTDVDANHAETRERFDALDKKLDTFRDAVSHGREDVRYVEADVIAIHKGLVRAKVPGIPKDLPSQVRAKGERPSKPVKRARRR